MFLFRRNPLAQILLFLSGNRYLHPAAPMYGRLIAWVSINADYWFTMQF